MLPVVSRCRQSQYYNLNYNQSQNRIHRRFNNRRELHERFNNKRANINKLLDYQENLMSKQIDNYEKLQEAIDLTYSTIVIREIYISLSLFVVFVNITQNIW